MFLEEVKCRIAIGSKKCSVYEERKDEARVKEQNRKDSDLEYGIVCL